MMAADVKVSGVKGAPKCSLNADDCVSLQDILLSFNAPINEEHAWALCYQCAKCFKNAFDRVEGDDKLKKCYLVSQLDHVMLHKDGQVHPSTIYDDSGGTYSSGSSRTKAPSSSKMVLHLGIVIFLALDFGVREEEERNLSPELERLIDMMTGSSGPGDDDCPEKQQETDDEGIERDSGESSEDDHSGGAVAESSTETGGGVVNCSASCSSSQGKSNEVTLERVIEACTAHVPAPSQAEAHYRAVCRALVAEALELASFLETISKGTKALRSSSVSSYANANGDTRDSLSAGGGASLGGRHSGAASSSSGASSPDHLDSLCFSDWARLWMQVMQQLRHGVQLKKVAAAGETGSSIVAEYELTPYEILMDDIRSRRYKLNKVMVDGDIPHRVKKDAHAIILDFIRSRPPLKKASERRLPPPPKRARSPRELLMESIKGGTPLRHTSSPHKSVSVDQSFMFTKEVEPAETSLTSTRRLIKVDFSKLMEDYDEDDEDEIIRQVLDSPLDTDLSDHSGFGREGQVDGIEVKAGKTEGKGRTQPTPWRRTGIPSITKTDTTNIPGTSASLAERNRRILESYDLATQCPTRRSVILNRRHSILGCERDSLNQPHLRPNSTANSTISTSSSSSAASAASALSFDSENNLSSLPPELSCSRISLQDEFLQSKHCQQAMECLTLTLEEIVHIRSVLTKAELESLPVEGHVKEDVEKRKVCFLCLKTRFSIFGPWGQKCKMCKRTVCAKCYSKMRIPTEHFSRVPVFALSPNLSPEEEEDEDEEEVSGKAGPSSTSTTSFPRSLVNRLLVTELPQGLLLRSSVGSAPSSPNLPRSPLSNSPQHQPHSNRPPSANAAAVMPHSVSSSSADRDTGERKCGDGAEAPPSNNPHILQNGSAASSQSSSMKHTSTPLQRRGRLTRSKTLGRPVGIPQAEKLKGLQMNVCHDCKTMVLHIIKTSRTKRNNAIKNLSLDLSPVY
ncbi:protein spire isoform X2 [Ischnura elegans]|uniref:protein spire isoform X2 n=1 Tax=Ischnura elegans TaxID=197161 RepID=UPI001ED89AB9|nr:protein spire isoform X2 [Ischnura elegans]